jgi:hypothetical protein
MNLSNLRTMIDRAVGREPTEVKDDPDKPVLVPNRANRRAMKRSHYKAYESATRANRPRSRTGKPDWFRTMQFKARIKEVLSQSLTIHLYPGSHDGEPPRELEALSNAGFKNVWLLSQADRADLLAVKGIGPAKLKIIRAALVSRSVPVAWKAE